MEARPDAMYCAMAARRYTIMESTNCLFDPLVNGRMVASTPEVAAEQSARFAAVSAAHRCPASTMGRSSEGQSAFVVAFGSDIYFNAALGVAFSDGLMWLEEIG